MVSFAFFASFAVQITMVLLRAPASVRFQVTS